MINFKTLLKTKHLPDWFITVNIINVTFAIVGWPFVVFMSMVAFTHDPITQNTFTGLSDTFDTIVFLSIISYPVFIILLMILNFRLSHIYRKTSILFSILPLLVTAFFAYIYIKKCILVNV